MNKDQIGETILGAIVAFVAVGFLVFALTQGGQASTGGGYTLSARFNRVDGISVGSDVRLSGVKVGAVSGVALDPQTYQARVTVSVDPKVKVPEDSVAKIASDGLLGGAFVAIEPGGAEATLAPGQEIAQTQGSLDLLTMLLSAMSSMGGDEEKEAEQAPQPEAAP